jgi:hypothetical protein
MPALTRVGTAFFLGKKSGGGSVTEAGEAIFHADKGTQDPTWNATTEYTWTVPAGVTEISVVCVGGGGSGEPRHDGASGGGAGLAYKNNIAVTPGSTILVFVGGGGAQTNWENNGNAGIRSQIEYPAGYLYAYAGGGREGEETGTSGYLDNTSHGSPIGNTTTERYDGGGKGGRGYHQSGCRQAGGGAGGYSNSPDNGNGAEGGDCGNPSYAGTNASAGANGAGGGGHSKNGSDSYYSSGGGGVGIYGRGSSGIKGDNNNNDTPDSQSDWGGGGGSYDPWTLETSGLTPNSGYVHNTGYTGYSSDSDWTTFRTHNQQDLGNDYRRDLATQGRGSTRPDGGFPGGGGGGGNGGSPAGYGGHGCVRIVWGTINSLKREFPTQGVNKTDEYPGHSGATIQVYGRQMMY